LLVDSASQPLGPCGHRCVYSRIIGFGIGGEYIDGVAACRMFNQAIAGNAPPVRISTDHDPLFRFHRWLGNLRILEVEEIKSVPHAPMSHPFVERLIGTIRREYLDRIFFWNSLDLERKLMEFQLFYNDNRTHRSLNGATPAERTGRPSPPRANFAVITGDGTVEVSSRCRSPLDW
jgi:putative transposase